ncbi:ATP-binding protein [Agrobacterium vitis]|uniref:ATP-binding protein n=1 Tax=Agrobacterium vitis TaxID=373 RepID=A0AAE2RBM6_AGRVI|nr:ATP-binding protein [Agrobacterium vitis]MBF2715463.1 ATP-binding protein [Agrobacterium vitis]
MSFERSRLFSESFLQDRPGIDSNEQERFKGYFLAMRARVEPLVARVLRDMPEYTVHDITHLDALWETASLVAADDLWLNPAEAFVFGGAILLHDASMTIAAYPGGIDDLKMLLEWRDFAALFKAQNGYVPDDKFVLTNVLRILHARHAEELAGQSWPSPSGGAREYLIETSEIRQYYGPTIGKIAYSHWWPISQVQAKLSGHLGPMPPFTQYSVDRLKLASLLRVADAIHLDRRRAPPFVRALDRPKGYSDLHWIFQSRLGFPRVEGDALQFSAGEACPVEESESWWLGYDALTLADRELRETDLLLKDAGHSGLRVRRVKGVQNPSDLAHDVPVVGWKPVNSPFHISDVPRIISIFGGEKLYGSEWYAPLRELIQNAADAIQARRLLQSLDGIGVIDVTLEDRDDGSWLIVEDDGVGMSETVLTQNLVDFGSSLWRTTAVNGEFPGLAANGMNAVGRFGIGFFSVFMIAKDVNVVTRRYDQASSSALKLSFNNGFNSRPILMVAGNVETPKNGGTRIELKLLGNPQGEDKFKFVVDGNIRNSEKSSGSIFEYNMAPSDLCQLIKEIAPCSESRIRVTVKNQTDIVVEANDWLTIDPLSLYGRISDDIPTHLSKNINKLMRPIRDTSGNVIGRAAIWPSIGYSKQSGVLVSGGFRIQSVSHLAGVLLGEVQTAARSSGTAIIDNAEIKEWAAEQSNLILKCDISDERRALMAEVILELGGDINRLPIVQRDGKWYNEIQLAKLFRSLDEVTFHLGDVIYDDDDDTSSSAFENNFEIDDQVFFIPTLSNNFGVSRSRVGRNRRSQLESIFVKTLAKSWKIEATVSEDWTVVGKVGYTDILRHTTTFAK